MKHRLLLFVVALAGATTLMLVFVRPDPAGRARVPASGHTEETSPGTPAGTAPETGSGSDSPTAPTQTGLTQTGPEETVSRQTDSPGSSIQSAHPPAPPDAIRARVVRLADGDSFEVSWIDPRPENVARDEVRLNGINAPESNACFGQQARKNLERMAGDAEVLIEIVEIEDEGFGRLIAHVWSTAPSPRLVNLSLVEAGAALAMTDAGPFSDQLQMAQQRAQSNSRGLWFECASAASIEITAVDFDAPGRDNFNLNGESIEITNLGPASVDMSGWGLRDESTRHRFVFPEGFGLDPDQSVLVKSGCDPAHNSASSGSNTRSGQLDTRSGKGVLFWCSRDPIWNNGGDTAYLSDASGRFVSWWNYDG